MAVLEGAGHVVAVSGRLSGANGIGLVADLQEMKERNMRSMQKYKRLVMLVGVMTASWGVVTGAQAEDASLTGNIGLVTNYKYRGQDQYVRVDGTQRHVQPALQGGVDYAFPNGFYVGNWNSTIRLQDAAGNRSRVEMDFYGGYKFATGTVSWDVGVLRYQYPGAASINTTEAYVAASHGEVTGKYSHTVSRRYFGLEEGRGTGYVSLAWNHPLQASLTLQAAVGHTLLPVSLRHATGLPNYTDYSLGLAWQARPDLTATVAVVGADKRSSYGQGNKARVIAGLKYAL